MKNLLQSLVFGLVAAISLPSFVLAKGVASVTAPGGGVPQEYEISIASTQETLYVRYGEDDMFILKKGNCQIEEELQVCTGGEGKLVNYGVSEAIAYESLMVFTNTTNKTLTVPGSAVTMEPNTVLLELLNENGRYITVMGRIDANNPDDLSEN
ncbi:hypothetical protein Xen7305DRAFT_00012990 [Xenococcus sp. PCC 7305]|uniref:hypothetical protein n=1 Tax=Xenococcus sp. PCC 7305 TaxID=102125 RepID=UPI0002AC1A04|nr:hypothetical protein [Xenococcus sp. PCC 7305]ELS01595.1 hypothetical protein Xen7305DRAFT_00012990 [Xenococcus sp. PCC 7305]